MRIALATAAHLPQLSEDDRVLHDEMLRRGIDAQPVVWDGTTDWTRYDAVVTRSIWDYHLKYAHFLAWLDALEAGGARVYNPPALERWNSDKHYMLELERRGVHITPTRIVERGGARTLADIMAETGWQRVVVKPTVASTGFATWQVNAPAPVAAEQRFAAQVAAMSVLVQQFVTGVAAGERSFVFIGGEFTHCVLKKAAGEELRVHIEWGGTVERIDAPADQIAWAQSVVAAVDQPWLYARVDAVADRQGRLVLMELEMLEPELFFAYNPAAVDRFIRSVT
ncbi:MAG: ATP-grasp domain-containing protein [Gemmatimonadota bacterium]